MATFGYDVKSVADVSGFDTGRKYGSKFTLTEDGTITELHCWTKSSGVAQALILSVYADNTDAPGALKGYGGPVSLPTDSSDYEVVVTGLSIALVAGTYWLVWTAETGGGNYVFANNDGEHQGIINGATFNPPSDPFGSPGTSGSRRHAIWAVYTPGGGVTTMKPRIITILN